MATNTIASAYVQIIPSAEGITQGLEKVIDPQAESAGKSAGGKMGNSLLSTAAGIVAKGSAIAFGAATAATGALAKSAVASYGQYEQLVGGVDKLYKDASGKLQEYADQAYATSGMSANQYMESATSFSAALINSLGGDTQKAADLTDVAMRAMSDNVNVFGSNMGDVEHAFQGFAKQNYTMLDNLKLGYGGTKEEMQRLIEDANTYRASIGETSDLSIDSFADIVTAIQSVQEAQGIAGTTGKEAMTTIEGSAAATKAAWENVITAIGRGEGMSEAISGLATSIFGSGEGTGLLAQILPRIQTAFEGIGAFIATAAPYITEQLPVLVQAVLPGLLESAGSLFSTLAVNLPGLIVSLLSTIGSIFVNNAPAMAEGLISTFTLAGQSAMDAFKSIDWPAVGKTAINFIATAAAGAGNLVMTALRTIGSLAMTAFKNIDWKSVGKAAISFISTAARGAIDLALSALKHVGNSAKEAFKNIDWAGVGKTIIGFIGSAIRGVKDKVVNALKNAGTSAKDAFKNIDWAGVGRTIIGFIGSAIRNVKENVVSALRGAGNSAKDAFKNIDWKSVGSNVINGIKNGITSTAYKIRDAAQSAARSALAKAKDFLGIHSPSTVFRDQVGKMIGLGWAEGIENTAGALSASAKTAASDAFKSAQDAFKPLNMDGQVNIGTDVQNADISRLASAKGQLATADERQDVGDALLNLLLMYLPQLASEKGIYLDTGKLVGELADPLDRELGYRASYSRG